MNPAFSDGELQNRGSGVYIQMIQELGCAVIPHLPGHPHQVDIAVTVNILLYLFDDSGFSWRVFLGVRGESTLPDILDQLFPCFGIRLSQLLQKSVSLILFKPH